MPQYWQVSNQEQLTNLIEFQTQALLAGKHLTYKIGKPESARSQSQNALFQVWAREYACHLLNQHKVTEEQQEDMKYTLQRHCYAEMGWDYLISRNADLFTGEEKPARAPTKRFGVGEMHQFLNWVQMKAANDGLILESKGEYKELQEAQNR